MSQRSVRMLASLVPLVAVLTVGLGANPTLAAETAQTTQTAQTAQTDMATSAAGAAASCDGRSKFGIAVKSRVVAIRRNPAPNARVLGALRQFAEVNACDPTTGASYVKCGQRSVVWYRVAGRGGFVPATCVRLLFRLANPN